MGIVLSKQSLAAMAKQHATQPVMDVRHACRDYALPAATATGVKFCGMYRLLISSLPTIKIYPTTKTIFGLVGHAVQKLYFLNKDSARHWQWS
jgi:hypothetical protein